MIGLDTNVIARYLLADDKKQADAAERLIDYLIGEHNLAGCWWKAARERSLSTGLCAGKRAMRCFKI